MISREIKGILPKRKTDAHKGDFGTALLICGSALMPGAAIISSRAALRCGVGLCVTASGKSVINAAASAVPEAVFADTEDERTLTLKIQKADAILFGPGMGLGERTFALLETVIANGTAPLVIDADGINAVARGIQLNRYAGKIVLTPHAGEAARLLGTTPDNVQADRMNALKKCVLLYGTAVVLKGAGTLCGFTDGRIVQNVTGNPGMAKPGSGDMLSGMITSFLAQGIPFEDAVTAAVYLHGAAGDMAAQVFSQRAMQVSDMIDLLPDVFKQYE